MTKLMSRKETISPNEYKQGVEDSRLLEGPEDVMSADSLRLQSLQQRLMSKHEPASYDTDVVGKTENY